MGLAMHLAVGCNTKDDSNPAAPGAPAPTSTPTACPTTLPSGLIMADTPATLTTDSIHAFPVTLSAAGTINRVRIRLTSDTVTSAVVALYTNTASDQPGIRLTQPVGRALDTSTATAYSVATPALAPDIYWVAFIFTGAQPSLQTSTLVGRRFYSIGPHAELPAVMPTGSVYTSQVLVYSYVCD
jgi:hypothetical protein